MKKIFIAIFVFSITSFSTNAQQIAHAVDVKLVSTTGTKVVMEGGIRFSGTSNYKDDGETYLRTNPGVGSEDWNDVTGSGVYDVASTGHVYLASNAMQTITGLSKFYNLTVNNDVAVTLNNPLEIKNQLNLEKGYLLPGANLVYVSNPAAASVASSTNYLNSWIQGRLRRAINTSGQYIFPIGKFLSPDLLYAPVRIENKFNTNPAEYTAEYFPAQPFDQFNLMSPPLDHISDVEYWEISSNVASGVNDDAAVSLSWRNFSQVSPSAAVRDSLLVAHYLDRPPFIWEAEFNAALPNIVVGADQSFGWVTSNKLVGSFTFLERRFTLGSRSPFNMLPIQILNWDVVMLNKQVHATWKVVNDVNITRYEVEKSLTGSGYSMLKQVASMRSAGTSTYGVIDRMPAKGWNYYRLKITDEQGKVSYTSIKKIFIKEEANWAVYPNPTDYALNVEMRGTEVSKKLLEVFDAAGKLVLTKNTYVNYISLNVSRLAKGTYTIRLSKNGISETKTFVKQ